MVLTGAALLEAVEDLRAGLTGIELRLEALGADEARRTRAELLGQIDDYLLPRLREADAPLIVVVGGSTGAGKSTILNSLIGREISPAGILRPTTTTPALVANPEDLDWFKGDRVLPRLPRLSGPFRTGATGLFLLADEDVPKGLALLDAPDIDSVVETNRRLGAQLLAAGDLWLFVTTAARYGDAVPWEFLRRARERSTSLALVLNRVPPEAWHDVPTHLAELLRREELEDTPVLTLPETSLDDGLIPEEHLAPVREWLNGLAADAQTRAAVVRKTLEGALTSLAARVEVVAAQVEAQVAAAGALAGDGDAAYSAALREIEDGLSGAPLLRAEVLARWHEFIGTGDVMRQVQTVVGRFRDRVVDVVLGRPPVEEEVSSAVEQSITVLVVAACDKAADRTVGAWGASPAGRALLESGDAPRGSTPELRSAVDDEVRSWQKHVLDLVAAQGASKRIAGRAVSLGVNAVGAALMVVVFAHSGGLTGGEVVIAGGTAAVSQRLLEALFGDQAVRDLTTTARADLLNRIRGLVQAQSERFQRAARAMADDPSEAEVLRAALGRIEAARS